MQLTILGNSGPYPAPGGACSGYLLSQGDTHVLLDCGLGVLARLQEHISLGALSALVLTHLHFDHVSDAFDLAIAMPAGVCAGNARAAARVAASWRAVRAGICRGAVLLLPVSRAASGGSVFAGDPVRNGKICLYRRHQLARWIDRNVPGRGSAVGG